MRVQLYWIILIDRSEVWITWITLNTFTTYTDQKHLREECWTCFFETFPVGPNRSIEFWTEISGNFGWMDRAPSFPGRTGWNFGWMDRALGFFSLASHACEAHAVRARKTLTLRFTDFFTDFEEKTDCFAVYCIKNVKVDFLSCNDMIGYHIRKLAY